MGRMISAAPSEIPRRRIVRLEDSNPAVPVPAWAKLMYASGVGAGGGGAAAPNVSNIIGGGGGAGAGCNRTEVPLDGVASVAVEVGVGGQGAQGTIGAAYAAGTNGGDTTITAGSRVIRLGGGVGAATEQGGPGGTVNNGGQPAALLTMVTGVSGNQGNSNGRGVGGHSDFGMAARAPVDPSVDNFQPVPSPGFGAGGTGSSGSGHAEDGSHGIVILEFVEAQ